MAESAALEGRLKKLLSDFTFEFIKIATQSSYFSPSHPLSISALKELHNKFHELGSAGGNISYSLHNAVKKDDIEIKGSVFSPVLLSRLFEDREREHFIRKFVNAFDNLGIMSMTLPGNIARDEFEKFLELIISMQDRDRVFPLVGKEFDPITEALIQRKISNIFIIHRHDLIDADLPLNVNLIISGIKKRLKTDPDLSRIEGSRLLQKIGKVIAEHFEQITDINLISEIFYHIEPLSSDLSIHKDVDFKKEILLKLPDLAVADVLRNFLKSLSDAKQGIEQSEIRFKHDEKITKNLIRRLCFRLFDNPHDDIVRLIKEAFNFEILELKDLPETVKESLKNDKMVDQFMRMQDEFLKNLRKIQNRESYREYIGQLKIIISVLLQRNEYRRVSSILEILKEQLKDPSPEHGWQKEEIQSLTDYLRTEILYEKLISLMQNEKREIKELASDLFILLGSDSCRYLINLIVTTEDLSVRREVFTTLVRLGDIARPYIEEEVRNFKHTWFALRNLIKILGELGNGESVRSFASHFSHKNSKVREECLNSAARLLQGESETFIFPLLKDEDSGIRRKAVSILSSFQSENTALFNLINDKLRKRLKSEETEEDTDFQIVCAKALLEYESVWKKVSSKFEETLLSALKHESGIKGVFGLTKYREKPVELKMAIIDAVGAIGTRNCLEDLEKLSDHPDLNIRIKSRESAEKIKKRTITSR